MGRKRKRTSTQPNHNQNSNQIAAKKSHRFKSCILQLYFNLSLGCIDCGERNPQVLTNDHVLDNKCKSYSRNATIRSIRHVPLSELKEQLFSCEIRCINCHMIETVLRRQHNQQQQQGEQQRNCRYQQEMIQFRQDIVDQRKQEIRQCTRCEYRNKTLSVYHFHHLNPLTKIASIAEMVNKRSQYSILDIQEELEKCQMLCGNCHFIVTAQQQGYLSLKDFTWVELLRACLFLFNF